MPGPEIFALDPQLNESMRAETRGEAIPLALRRFQDCWESCGSTSAAQRATAAVLARYHQLFPSASPVVRVARLCDVVGVRLTGLRPRSRFKPSYTVVDSPSRHPGYSGSVRFSRQGAPSIEIPEGVDGYRARVSAAHEIGHVLVHKRGDNYDDVTTRLPASVQEEAIAEYAARLLLLPTGNVKAPNLAEYAVRWASDAEVTVHAAACRLGDPDQRYRQLNGAVLWKLSPKVRSDLLLSERLTPAWHVCPGAFVPIGRCKARVGSLVAELANGSTPVSGVQIEDVRIGSFAGKFKVHGFAWGSVSAGTRLVLSVFEGLADTRLAGREAFTAGEVSDVLTRGEQQPLLSEGWF